MTASVIAQHKRTSKDKCLHFKLIWDFYRSQVHNLKMEFMLQVFFLCSASYNLKVRTLSEIMESLNMSQKSQNVFWKRPLSLRVVGFCNLGVYGMICTGGQIYASHHGSSYTYVLQHAFDFRTHSTYLGGALVWCCPCLTAELVGVCRGSGGGGGVVYNNTIQWALKKGERDRWADTKHDGRHRLIKVIITKEEAAAS